MTGEIGAKEKEKYEKDNQESVSVDLYFGIFFDGTNNNKVQSMIGQHFRRKEIWKKKKTEIKDFGKKTGKNFDSIKDVISQSRSYWESKDSPFSKTDLDKLYGTQGVDGKKIEKGIVQGNQDEYRWSSIAEDNKGETAQKRIKSIAENDASLFTVASVAGSASANATYTNIAVLESLYKTTNQQAIQKDNTDFHYCLYIEGSGADTEMTSYKHLFSYIEQITGLVKDVTNNVSNDFGKSKSTSKGNTEFIKGGISGLAFGVGNAGVAQKCRTIAQRVKIIYEKYATTNVKSVNLHFDIFGFSRGATTARLFTYIINPTSDTKYTISNEDYKLFTGTDKIFLPDKKDKEKDNVVTKIEEKEVRYLGIFDTVSSIGILNNGVNKILADKIDLADAEEFKDYKKSIYHEDNVADFGLYATEKAKHLLHICAMDENRTNFALVDISNSLTNGTEIFIPGCHTDIGGGCTLGQDSIKILNKSFIVNKDAIFNDAYGKLQKGVEIASTVKDSLSSISETIASVKEIVKGVSLSTTGVSIPSGALLALNGAYKSYKGEKASLLKTYSASVQANEMFVEASDQINIIDPFGKLQADAAIADLKDENLFERIGDLVTKQGSNIKNIGETVSTANEHIEKLVDDLNKNGQSNNVLDKVEQTAATTIDALDIIEDVLDITKKMFGLITDIKTDLSDIQQYVGTRYPKVPAMQILSSEVMAIVNETKSMFVLSKRICQVNYNTLTGQKKRLLLAKDSRPIYLLNATPHTHPSQSQPCNILPVSASALRELGWGPKGGEDYDRENLSFSGRADKDYLAEHDSETIIIDQTKAWGKIDVENVAIYKYAHVGYSNISLRAMIEWTKNDNLFESFPDGQYEIPADLKSFEKEVNNCTSTTGRHFCEPTDYNQYRLIRCKYLHFSSNQQIISPADNGLVNGISLKPLNGNRLLLTRRIYAGDQAKPSSDMYMCDYTNGSINAVNMSITGVVEKKQKT